MSLMTPERDTRFAAEAPAFAHLVAKQASGWTTGDGHGLPGGPIHFRGSFVLFVKRQAIGRNPIP